MSTAPITFIQTGDWHLGQSYCSIDPELAGRLREARLEAVDRVLAAAEARGAAFVLAAGDQFEGNMVDPALVRRLLDTIAARPGVEVHMIPGNHDPCEPGSVYERADFRSPPNLHLHREAGAVRLEGRGVTLYPCPCFARYGDDPMAWIGPRDPADGWRIGLAHGSLPNFPGAADRNYPILADAPGRYDLDYVALGDWHKPTPDPADRPGERMYYAGAPEVGGWDDIAAGSALEVVLDPGRPPRVSAFRVGKYEWIELDPELHGADDIDRLVADLAPRASPDRLVRVRPTGLLTPADRAWLEGAIAEREADFAEIRLDPRDLKSAAADGFEPPADPLLREAHRRLARLAADPSDGVPGGLPADMAALDGEVVRLAVSRFRGLLP